MDAMTLTALRQSIEKWERNAVAETPKDFTIGPATCPLCEQFWLWGCRGCPVMDRTGQPGCIGTQYDEAAGAWSGWFDYPRSTARRDAAHAAASAEVAFLRSLLPEEEDRQ